MSQNKKNKVKENTFSPGDMTKVLCVSDLLNLKIYNLYKLCQTWLIPYIQTQNLLSYNMESWRPSDCINELHCRRISWSWRTFFLVRWAEGLDFSVLVAANYHMLKHSVPSPSLQISTQIINTPSTTKRKHVSLLCDHKKSFRIGTRTQLQRLLEKER